MKHTIMRSTQRMNRGYTLIEVLTAIGISVVLVVIGLNTLPGLLSGRQLENSTEETILFLQEARNLTLASKDSGGEGARYGVRFETSPEQKAVFFKVSETAGSTDIKEILFTDNITITQSGFGGDGDVLFQRLTGTPDDAGLVRLDEAKTGDSYIIWVPADGRIFRTAI